MNTIDAVMIADGSMPVDSEADYLAAWQHLLDAGIVWHLQGSMVRECVRLVQAGKLKARPLVVPDKVTQMQDAACAKVEAKAAWRINEKGEYGHM